MYPRSLQQQTQETRIPIEHAEFMLAFRYRMLKIAYLTRFYIVQNFAKIGNIDQVINELYKMPELFRQLGESITGKPVPDEIVALLGKYDQRLKELVDSMLSNDESKADESIKALYALSDEFSTALSAFNPWWDKEVLDDYLLNYFKAVVDMIIAIRTNDYNKALDIFDQMVVKALDLGDYYAEGFLHLAAEPHEKGTISMGELNITKDIKLLATQLAYLTRFYIVAKITKIFGADYVAQRLYALPLNFHEKTQMVLGFSDSEGLLNLLSVYTVRLEELMDAILSGDPATIDSGMNELYRYSDQLADYLAAINPYWTKAKWKEIFYSFNNRIIDEAIALQTEGTGLTSTYQTSLPLFEKMLQSALQMGDYFAEGMIQYITTSDNPPVLEEQYPSGDVSPIPGV